MKEKTCKNKNCKKKFTHENGLIGWCSPTCGYEYSKQLKEKKQKKDKTEARIALREFKKSDKPVLKELAQKLINQYSRKRDEYENGLRCCTCGKTDGKFDGGHFLPTSGYSAIRYNTNQIHLQCVNCNQYNGGRYKEYRLFMIDKYGIEYVEALEATKTVQRGYSVEYYQKLIKVVRKKLEKVKKKLQ